MMSIRRGKKKRPHPALGEADVIVCYSLGSGTPLCAGVEKGLLISTLNPSLSLATVFIQTAKKSQHII